MTTAKTMTIASDDDFLDLRTRVAHKAQNNMNEGKFYTTRVENAYELFRAALPNKAMREHYDCQACRRFVDKYGGLASISDLGTTHSAIWPNPEDVAKPFRKAVAAVKDAVESSQVTGIFLSTDDIWGLPQNKDRKRGLIWTHFHADARPYAKHKQNRLLTPSAEMAELRSEAEMLRRILADYPKDAVREAVRILSATGLHGTSTHLAMAKRLLDLHAALEGTKGQERNNLIWKFVGEAPRGDAHLRGGMLGTLLDSIKAGEPFSTISRKWNEKMDPLAYRRSQTPPSRGNIERAEKAVESLGIKASLARRHARLEDLELIWQPTSEPDAAEQDGVFGHLKAKGEAPIKPSRAPATTITWEKFRRDVLPEATDIEVLVPSHDAFGAFVTASDPDAPPILKWDRPDARNSVSWYLYSRGSPASQWGLSAGTYAKASGICLLPPQWGDNPTPSRVTGFAVIIDGARDSPGSMGRGIFTEDLPSDLHGVRSTLEAYYSDYEVEGLAESSASGLIATNPDKIGFRLRAQMPLGPMEYLIDRME